MIQDLTQPAVAHSPIPVGPPQRSLPSRAERESLEADQLATFATRAQGAGNRAVVEEPDTFRTCFERDLDRIHHSKAFRRLAGKCQVFVAPEDDHLRTRLTHAIEVCQVAVSIARPTGLNVALTAAAATGHDCGHGPAGHASEGALSPFVEGGYHHAVYGADVVLTPLNLCAETLDAIRNHSWNRPAPATPEGEVVAWADRIAYVCHDFEDAVDAGIVSPKELPKEVSEVVGRDRRSQLHGFITAMVETIATTGTVALRSTEAQALAAFRAFNYERIYLRPESVEQADLAAKLISSLAEYYLTNPSQLPESIGLVSGSPEATAAAVQYVSGMTDRFAHRVAMDLLGWDERSLPRTA
ncbi:MAG: HD domain-containing protein [Acidimicrobiales bacterium]|nr:HD domain-containing protein [Acidimicrobiales bacterium]